jgi:hypothetical protein
VSRDSIATRLRADRFQKLYAQKQIFSFFKLHLWIVNVHEGMLAFQPLFLCCHIHRRQKMRRLIQDFEFEMKIGKRTKKGVDDVQQEKNRPTLIAMCGGVRASWHPMMLAKTLTTFEPTGSSSM